jgi:hypothetical protein
MGEMPLRQAGRSMERGDQDGITVTDEVSREQARFLPVIDYSHVQQAAGLDLLK